MFLKKHRHNTFIPFPHFEERNFIHTKHLQVNVIGNLEISSWVYTEGLQSEDSTSLSLWEKFCLKLQINIESCCTFCNYCSQPVLAFLSYVVPTISTWYILVLHCFLIFSVREHFIPQSKCLCQENYISPCIFNCVYCRSQTDIQYCCFICIEVAFKAWSTVQW